MGKINKKPLLLGAGLTCALLFMFSFSESMGGASKGPSFQNWSWFGKLLLLLPGLLITLYSLFPNSILGKFGGIIFKFFLWIQREGGSRSD